MTDYWSIQTSDVGLSISHLRPWGWRVSFLSSKRSWGNKIFKFLLSCRRRSRYSAILPAQKATNVASPLPGCLVTPLPILMLSSTSYDKPTYCVCTNGVLQRRSVNYSRATKSTSLFLASLAHKYMQVPFGHINPAESEKDSSRVYSFNQGCVA